MNSFVEILNRCGENVLPFAWPMLWQSSLLISILFVLDFALRRRVRATIRYTLWLVVLIKLILPPTMASPTSPRWWIHFSNPPPAKVKTVPVTVTYGDSVAPPDFQLPQIQIPKPPPPHLSLPTIILMASAVVSAVLFAWLLVRWRSVTRKICDAEISNEFHSLLDEVRQLAGLRSEIRLKLTEDSMSPAVCGLFRPTILLPQSLARNLSREQLRAVLLHEAIHLRRGDVWVNCAQALLQIVYWWHPLLWLANARIRRVREEAVDDAVILALRDDAEIYAPTLLEVAKFAFRRPLAALGLVGILESRSALRQRIERLMNFPTPRKAGLTIISVLGILAFTAVAVPMGEAPPSKDNSFSFDANSLEATLTAKVNPEIFIRNLKAQAAKSVLSPTNDYTEILLELLRSEDVDCNPPHEIKFNTKTGEITTENTMDKLGIFRQVILQLNRPDGQCELPLPDNFRRKSVLLEARIYQMRAADFAKIASDLQFYPADSSGDAWWSSPPEKFNQLLKTLKSSGFNLIERPRIQTGSGMPAEFYVGNNTNSVDFECKPFAGEGFVDLRMRGTIIANAAFTNSFNIQASAQSGGGIVVRSENLDGDAESNLLTVISLQIVTNVIRDINVKGLLLTTDYAAKKVEAGQLVQDGKMFYESGRFEDAESNLHAALKLDPDNQAAFYYLNLVKRALYSSPQTPKVIPNRLDNPAHSNLLVADAAGENSDASAMTFKINRPIRENDLEKLLSDAGVKNPPTFFFFTSEGILFVRGSAEQLVLAQGVVLKLNGLSSKEIEAANNRLLKQAQLPANPEWDNRLEMRTFKVDTFTFAAMRNMPGLQTNDYTTMAKDFFERLGLNLEAAGKSIAFNDKLGLLFVKATASDLDTIERAIVALNQVTPQIHIKARFIEVPKGDVDPNLFTNAVAGPGTGILSDAKFRNVLRKLENQNGVETLAEPEVVTTSGRQTQMRATVIQECVTNFTLVETSTYSNVVPQIGNFEIGPTVDVVPYVLADGYTIDLTAIVSQLDFLGYDKPPNEHISRFDTRIHLPKVLPGFRSQKAEAVVNLWDNQTLVLGNLKSIFVGFTNGVGVETNTESKFFADAEKKSPNANKEFLVFITATIVDPAGNRVHSDDEWLSKLPAIPPQPQQ